jgi:hypothetical protein
MSVLIAEKQYLVPKEKGTEKKETMTFESMEKFLPIDRFTFAFLDKYMKFMKLDEGNLSKSRIVRIPSIELFDKELMADDDVEKPTEQIYSPLKPMSKGLVDGKVRRPSRN